MSFFRKSQIPPHLLEYFEPAEIGLEQTPDAYVAEMVAVFREVRRVLRDDGVVWLNIGDSYNGGGLGGGLSKGSTLGGASNRDRQGDDRKTLKVADLKPKDLMMIPARVALALQADGWYLRSQLPWLKRSTMPESVTDRPGSAVEYVFLLTKQPKYYYDADAVKRAGAYPAGTKAAKGSTRRASQDGVNSRPAEYAVYSGTRNFRNSDLFFDSLTAPYGLISNGDIPLALDVNPSGFDGAHFATFPPRLIEPLILAGSRPGDAILDPFSGAGTTALVADRLGRHGIGIELNPGYSALASNRVSNDSPLFAEVSCA